MPRTGAGIQSVLVYDIPPDILVYVLCVNTLPALYQVYTRRVGVCPIYSYLVRTYRIIT